MLGNIEYVQVKRKTEYPLLTAEFLGEAIDGFIRYELVVIHKWSDKTENAREVAHKSFYFNTPNAIGAQKMIDALGGCSEVFKRKENTRFIPQYIGRWHNAD